MSITDVEIRHESLTITAIGEFPVAPSRLWSAFLDPRQLEGFWGGGIAEPVTFTRHDAYPGGVSEYTIGGKTTRKWRWESVVAPRTFAITDRSSDTSEEGQGVDDQGHVMRFTFEADGEGSILTVVVNFPTEHALQQHLDAKGANPFGTMFQELERVLDQHPELATEYTTTAESVGEKQLRVTRLLADPIRDVWAAHVTPEQLRVWKLGPEGWTMPVCEFRAEPGTNYVMEWKNELGGESFGVVGDIEEVIPEHRLVLTEQFIGAEDGESLHEYTFTELGDDTLITMLITYNSTEERDQALASGIDTGTDAGYNKLQRLLES